MASKQSQQSNKELYAIIDERVEHLLAKRGVAGVATAALADMMSAALDRILFTLARVFAPPDKRYEAHLDVLATFGPTVRDAEYGRFLADNPKAEELWPRVVAAYVSEMYPGAKARVRRKPLNYFFKQYVQKIAHSVPARNGTIVKDHATRVAEHRSAFNQALANSVSFDAVPPVAGVGAPKEAATSRQRDAAVASPPGVAVSTAGPGEDNDDDRFYVPGEEDDIRPEDSITSVMDPDRGTVASKRDGGADDEGGDAAAEDDDGAAASATSRNNDGARTDVGAGTVVTSVSRATRIRRVDEPYKENIRVHLDGSSSSSSSSSPSAPPAPAKSDASVLRRNARRAMRGWIKLEDTEQSVFE